MRRTAQVAEAAEQTPAALSRLQSQEFSRRRPMNHLLTGPLRRTRRPPGALHRGTALVRAGGRGASSLRVVAMRSHALVVAAAPLAAILLLAISATGAGAAAPASAPKEPAYDPDATSFPYPYEVRLFTFDSQQQKVRMAYLE